MQQERESFKKNNKGELNFDFRNENKQNHMSETYLKVDGEL